VVHNDLVIVDFEGEPRARSRSAAQALGAARVAGMVRSIRLRAHAPPASRGRHRARGARAKIETWARASADEFLAGYHAAAADLASIPSEPGASGPLPTSSWSRRRSNEVRYDAFPPPRLGRDPAAGLQEWIGP